MIIMYVCWVVVGVKIRVLVELRTIVLYRTRVAKSATLTKN